MCSHCLRLLAVVFASTLLTSCISNEELQQKLDRRTDSYRQYEERRGMRADARDERYDAWIDRIMD